MSFYQQIIRLLIEHPPKWILFILISIFVSVTFAKIFPKLSKGSSPQSKLIYNLEVIMTFVLANITLHSFYDYFCESKSLSQAIISFLILIWFTTTTFLSIRIYHNAEKK